MTELLQVIIEQLCQFFPEFHLFFNTHFEFVERTSLKPTFRDNGTPIFEKDIRVRRKILTEQDKHDYHGMDLELWRDVNE